MNHVKNMRTRNETRNKLRRQKIIKIQQREGESLVSPFHVGSCSAEHMTQRSATRCGKRRRW